MPQSITIASGKGGVGKTCIAVNLSLTLASMGLRVKLLDADFGLANSHVLMGINSTRSIRDVISGERTLEEVAERVAPGLDLYAGGSALSDLLNVDPTVRYRLIRNFDPLAAETDVLLIDAPAGASDNALSFVAASDRVLVVIVPEPTSFMDAYALIKAANIDYGLERFSIVVNMAANEAEAARHFEKFRAITMRFLSVELTHVGHVPLSNALSRSIVALKPIMLGGGNPSTPEGAAFRKLANGVLHAPVNATRGLRFFDDAGGIAALPRIATPPRPEAGGAGGMAAPAPGGNESVTGILVRLHDALAGLRQSMATEPTAAAAAIETNRILSAGFDPVLARDLARIDTGAAPAPAFARALAAQIVEDDPDARLGADVVWILGPSGAGRTSLAAKLGAHAARLRPDRAVAIMSILARGAVDDGRLRLLAATLGPGTAFATWAEDTPPPAFEPGVTHILDMPAQPEVVARLHAALAPALGDRAQAGILVLPGGASATLIARQLDRPEAAGAVVALSKLDECPAAPGELLALAQRGARVGWLSAGAAPGSDLRAVTTTIMHDHIAGAT
ncbi:MAG: P-loop NTPase [Gemmobacter sp.]|jgi:flagellar biosynthesis protein FlhG